MDDNSTAYFYLVSSGMNNQLPSYTFVVSFMSTPAPCCVSSCDRSGSGKTDWTGTTQICLYMELFVFVPLGVPVMDRITVMQQCCSINPHVLQLHGIGPDLYCRPNIFSFIRLVALAIVAFSSDRMANFILVFRRNKTFLQYISLSEG